MNLQSLFRTPASALAASLLLAACAGTPLEPAPVADAAAVPAPAAAPGAPGLSSVAPVTARDAAAGEAGPVRAAKVVYFDYDSSTIRPEFQSVIDAHARWLGPRQDRRLTIAGHTDERGGREYNLALGQQRAEAVRRALQLLGVRPAQIEAISFGEEKPAEAGQLDAAWAKNRRAELNYR